VSERNLMRAAILGSTCLIALGCDAQSKKVSDAFDICLRTNDTVSTDLKRGIDGRRGTIQVGQKAYRIDIATTLYRTDSIAKHVMDDVGGDLRYVGQSERGYVNELQLIYAYRQTWGDYVIVRVSGRDEAELKVIGAKLQRCTQ